MPELGDLPIEPKFHEQMNRLARELDFIFNGDARGGAREIGFVLLTFPFKGHEGRANFISNGANREDLVVFFKEMIVRFEGQARMKGKA